MTGMVICRALHCYNPGGRCQPASRFVGKFGRVTKTCAACRAYTAAKQQEYRQRQRGPVPAESVADIDPAYAERLNRWLLGLVIRRDGHPLTRQVGQPVAPAGDDGSKKCSLAFCRKTHRTKYKLCPDCRERNRLRCRDRRAAAKVKGKNETANVI